MTNRVYLIFEVNCYLGRPTLSDRWKLKLGIIRAAPVEGFGSVWIANDSYDPLSDDYEAKALKLAGPLPSDEAQQFLNQLREVLVEAGLEVVEETTADD